MQPGFRPLETARDCDVAGGPHGCCPMGEVAGFWRLYFAWAFGPAGHETLRKVVAIMGQGIRIGLTQKILSAALVPAVIFVISVVLVTATISRAFS